MTHETVGTAAAGSTSTAFAARAEALQKRVNEVARALHAQGQSHGGENWCGARRRFAERSGASAEELERSSAAGARCGIKRGCWCARSGRGKYARLKTVVRVPCDLPGDIRALTQ